MDKNGVIFDVRKTSVNTAEILSGINAAIKHRRSAGVYDHYDMSKVTHCQLRNTGDPEQFLPMHLEAISQSWAVDINDFEILQKKTGIPGAAETFVKKVIWKLLKFYTYRLFSQQREYNFLAANILSLMEKAYGRKIAGLEARIRELKA